MLHLVWCVKGGVCRALKSGGKAQWDALDVSDVPASILRGRVCHSSCVLGAAPVPGRQGRVPEGSWGRHVGATGSAADDHAASVIHDLVPWVDEWAVVSSAHTRCIGCQPLRSGPPATVNEASPDGGGRVGWYACTWGQLAMMTRQGKGSRWLVLGCASLLLLQQQRSRQLRGCCCMLIVACLAPSTGNDVCLGWGEQPRPASSWFNTRQQLTRFCVKCLHRYPGLPWSPPCDRHDPGVVVICVCAAGLASRCLIDEGPDMLLLNLFD